MESVISSKTSDGRLSPNNSETLPSSHEVLFYNKIVNLVKEEGFTFQFNNDSVFGNDTIPSIEKFSNDISSMECLSYQNVCEILELQCEYKLQLIKMFI